VFEPYFTTKPYELGTGIGLAIVRRIAKRHGGTAQLAQGTLPGARIEVRLPRGETRASAPAAVAPVPPVATGCVRARVLVIDDEPLVLRSLEQVLSDEHEVVTAASGGVGLELLGRDRAFDLVLCDLQMPGVDAPAIHEALQTLAPELLERFAVMTGGVVTPRATQFVEHVRPRIVPKPLDLDDVRALVHEHALR